MTAALPPSKKPLSAWSAMVGAGARSLAKVLPLPASVRDLPPNERLDALMALAIRNDDKAGLISLLRKVKEIHRDQFDRFLAPNALSEAIAKNNPSCLARLLDAHANPDALFTLFPSNPNRLKGDRLLHAAIEHGRPLLLNMLINAGASPNLANENGQTALFTASRLGFVEMAQTLLQAEADSARRDKHHRLPLHYALAYYPRLDPLLAYSGMSLPAATAEIARLERGALIAKALLRSGLSLINLPQGHNPEGYLNYASLPILAGAIRVKDHELIQLLIQDHAHTHWLTPPHDTASLSQHQQAELDWLLAIKKDAGISEAIDFAKRLAATQNSPSKPSTPSASPPVTPLSDAPEPLAKARSILASRRAAEELRALLHSERRSPPAA